MHALQWDINLLWFYKKSLHLLKMLIDSQYSQIQIKMHWAEIPENDYVEEESTPSTQDKPIPSRLPRDVSNTQTPESMNTRSID